MGNDMNVIGGTFGAVAPEAASLPEAIKMTFATGGANNFWIILAIAVSFLIMILGIAGGIEKSCKVMIPALYVLFIILAIMMPFVPGSSEGYKYIFSLDLRGLLDVNVWVFAFGQCFFSLSVAGSGSVIYGSYLGKDVKIRQSAILCALFDTSAALLAMFIVIPAMATTGADLGNGGPGLMFIYLIPVFNNMGGIARIMFIFFYVAVLFAGLSSIINLFETPVAFLQEKLHFNRVTATAVIHIIGVAIALTIQPWTSQWMDMVSIYLCPLGALTAGIMFFWIMKKDTALAAVQEGDPKPVMHWFLSFGFPVTAMSCLLLTGFIALLRYVRGGRLFIIGGSVIVLGGLSMLVEFFQHITFGTKMFTWSLYVVSSCLAFGMFLILAGTIRPLREYLERRFFL